MELENKLGFDEVVDTICDIIESGQIVAEALEDGVQFTDAKALFDLAPKAAEIKGDWRKALDQFNDLDPEEAREAAQQIAARTGKLASRVISLANEAFDIVADVYGMVKQGLYMLDRVKRWAKSLRNPLDLAA